MSKIFNKKRHALIKNSRFGQYLLYALGEILLLVIGILIAMQINNWNEFNKARNREKITLLELRSDLQNNIAQLDELLTATYDENKRLKALDIIIDHLDSKKPYHDSLDISFWYVLNLGGITFKTSGYESLRSMGLDLINDSDLRAGVGNYYSVDIPGALGWYKELRDDFYKYMLDYFRKDFIEAHKEINGEMTPGVRPRDYEKLTQDVEFLQSMKVYYPLLRNFVDSHKNALKNAKTLTNSIDERLEFLE